MLTRRLTLQFMLRVLGVSWCEVEGGSRLQCCMHRCCQPWIGVGCRKITNRKVHKCLASNDPHFWTLFCVLQLVVATDAT